MGSADPRGWISVKSPAGAAALAMVLAGDIADAPTPDPEENARNLEAGRDALNRFKLEAIVDCVTGGGGRGFSALRKLPAADTSRTPTRQLAQSGTYRFPDQLEPGKVYVGQSQDIRTRLQHWIRKGRYDPSKEAETREVSGGKLDREWAEQEWIEDLGGIDGGRLSNKRNPIGKRRRGLKP